MKYLNSWFIFILERFNPVAYFIMIFIFLAAHFLTYQASVSAVLFYHFIPLFIAIVLLFFHLRLFDEIKDFESDTKNYPNRPLPRGLLKKEDLLNALIFIIIAELVLFSYYGVKTLLSGITTILYSLLMYKEFFLRKWLRSHLTIYAVTHTVIAILISVIIFTALSNKFIFQIPISFAYFSFGSWFLFNIFEFGRKTFASEEERQDIDSYSKNFGHYGALLLVIVMMIIGTTLLSISILRSHIIGLYFWSIILCIAGISYVSSDKKQYAKIYRILSFAYIVLIYGTIAVSNLLIKL